MKIQIITLKKKHLNEVFSLLSKDISNFKPKKNNLKIWNKLYTKKNSYSLVLLNSKCVIGFGSIFTITKVRGGKQAIIEDIVVDKKFRKLGLGKLLLKKLLDKAKKQKCYKVILKSKKNQVAFYQKIGFKKHNVSMQMLF